MLLKKINSYLMYIFQVISSIYRQLVQLKTGKLYLEIMITYIYRDIKANKDMKEINDIKNQK